MPSLRVAEREVKNNLFLIDTNEKTVSTFLALRGEGNEDVSQEGRKHETPWESVTKNKSPKFYYTLCVNKAVLISWVSRGKGSLCVPGWPGTLRGTLPAPTGTNGFCHHARLEQDCQSTSL